MKKIILSLMIMCSAMVFSQGTIPIPQIIGLPAALASKVDKVTGKSLVADTSVVKLTGVQAGAQVNKIEGIQKNGVALTITGKTVNVTVPTIASEIGAEPANSNIQSHISSISNPHATTKAQVGLSNVDNTSDVNKPISSAVQTALNGKQASGTYSTDIHANITALNAVSGINGGDETLTSIKTKLGAATSVSDGYLKYQDFVRFDGKQPAGSYLTSFTETDPTIYSWAKSITKPTYDYSEILSKPTLLSQFTNDLGNYGSFVTGTPWTSVGYWYSTYHPTTTSGYGLPAYPTTLPASDVYAWAKAGTKPSYTYSEVGAAPSSTVSNATHTGDVTGSTALTLATVNSNIGTFNNVTINAKGLATAGSNVSYLTGITSGQVTTALGYTPKPTFTENTGFNKPFGTTTGTVLEGRTFGTAASSNASSFQPAITGLTTNYIPKWNGSNFVNSLISDDGTKVQIYKSVNADILLTDGTLGTSYGGMLRGYGTTGSGGGVKLGTYDGGTFYPWVTVNAQALTSSISGIVNFTSTTPSASPTTGALVVGGGIGADHVRANNFYGNGSNLTGIQLPITLTTNGTSGAATFSGNTLNIPNYSSNSVDQTLTTVNGSTSGNIVGSMPFQTANYKKVIVYVNFVSGNATYTFPTQFNTEWNLHTNTLGASYSSVSVSGTSVTITGATNAAGVLIIEGY